MTTGLRLIKTGAAGLRRIYGYMRADFLRCERVSQAALRRALRRGAVDLFCAAGESGELCGYALCCARSLYGYVLINYFAVSPPLRGGGIGSEILCLLAREYQSRQGLIVELTDGAGSGPEAEKRRRFYGKNGFFEIPCDYSFAGVPTRIMVLPLRGTWEITRAAHLIIPELYSHMLSPASLERLVRIRRSNGG